VNFPELKDTEGKLDAKRAELANIFAQARPGGEGTIDLSKVKGYDDVPAAIKSLNDEMTDLGVKVEQLKAVQAAAGLVDNHTPGAANDDAPATKGAEKSFGEQFLKSAAVRQKGQVAHLDVDLKTLFARSAGWTPESTRSGLVVMSAQRPVQVTDVIPSVPTSQAAYKYMEETTFTNNAAEAAEGATYGEAALALTERSVTVEKVAVFIPVTDEQLEDEDGAASYLDMRLPFMVQQRLDGQLLTGNGTTPNVRGVNNVAGIQTQAKGADPTPDAVYKAMTLVRVTGRANPSAVIANPTDWQDVKLLKTVDGIYIWGSPTDMGPDRIWGVQVVLSDAQTLNTMVVGDFANYSLLAIRRGIDVKVSDSHSTYFIEGKQAIRATMRAAAVWTRGAAFCTVTGI